MITDKAMAKIELKERPQAILPCPRCINGQILAINDGVCLQCGYKEYSKEVMEEIQLPEGHPPCGEAEKIICPQCGKKVCLNNQTEPKVVRSHKDPITEGYSSRPWCDMSGEVIP